MSTIYKAILRTTDVQDVSMPKHAEILTVQMQGNHPCVWYLCDPYLPVAPRRIAFYGTGHSDANGRYIGTVLLYDDTLVLHAFEQVTA